MAASRIAVLIPCLNEEAAIGKVVADFRRELPDAEIYVYDNGSTDRTMEVAREAGAVVRRELRRGKGTVMQTMFREIDADYLVLVDGDDTYPAAAVKDLMKPVVDGQADMTVGSRLSADLTKFKKLNLFGNRMFAGIVNSFFRVKLTDILSGYRVMNRRLVKSVPLFERGFGIETELTIKALQRNLRIVEVPTPLGVRPEGSESKINIVSDGIKIVMTIAALFRDYKPLTLFGAVAILFGMLSIGVAAGAVLLCPTLHAMVPWLCIAALTGSLGFASLILAINLHTIDRRFSELEYLNSVRS